MREKPVEENFYHVFNRGTDKREIFMCDNDRYRFLASLYYYNDSAPTDDFGQLFEVQLKTNDNRNKLVDILAFTLMPNHFHMLVRPRIKDGLSEFMRKLGTGYTRYFNLKYERSGALFQGKYKFIEIKDEGQFEYLPFYIHFNPISLIEEDWKEGKTIKNKKNVLDFLKSYKWSSLRDYLGYNDNANIIHKEPLFQYTGSDAELEQEIIGWLSESEDSTYKDLILE